MRDALLVLGAAMRLTRVVTSDDIGQWWVKDPLNKRFPGNRYLAGLDCPNCCGFWIGAGVLALTVATEPTSRTGRAWRFMMAALALNVVVPQVGRRMDYWS